MERSGAEFDTTLPGYSALRETDNQAILDQSIYTMAQRQRDGAGYIAYYDNHSYDQYMRMHKVLVGESGAADLVDLADDLSRQALPRYLDAAGSAYIEAGVALTSRSAIERVELATRAEDCWQRSLQTSQRLLEAEATEVLYEDSAEFRTALSLAYTPVIKSMIVGNVTSEVRERAFADTLAIAQTSAVQLELAKQQQQHDAIADHSGFLHECNALLTLLNINDPRYVPSPSFDRADEGVYHRNQTHDIIIFNQHWGKIKKVIPVEVKAHTSKDQRERYWALLVRGKVHMIIDGKDHNPLRTIQAFSDIYGGSTDRRDAETVRYATENVMQLLRLYQKGQRNSELKSSSATKFHNPRYVKHMYRGV